jgi:SAM-dependent methyltransferase
MKLNNYDRIAAFYDRLSRLVYFNAQTNAQIDQLKYILPGSNILIVGGGTGWILDELCKLHATGLTITYIEVSYKMLALAKKRNIKNNNVKFIHDAIENLKNLSEFNVIQTAFLFDNFSGQRAVQVFDLVNKHLVANGLWLFSDFQYDEEQGKNWKWLLLKLMYVFFKLVSHVEASKLVNMDASFEKRNFTKIQFRTYYRGFIKGVVYKKQLESSRD